MPDLSGRALLREWGRMMETLVESASTASGRAQLPRELLEAMQRQLELVGEVVERERRLRTDLADRISAPVDAMFDLLEDTGATLRRQAESLEAAGRALEDTAGLMKRQAEMFEAAISALRGPADLAKAAAGAERSQRKRKPAKPR